MLGQRRAAGQKAVGPTSGRRMCQSWPDVGPTSECYLGLWLLESGQHFADYFTLFPKKLQRLLNTLQTIVKAKDQFFSLYSST